mgnify:CR=1 FL=1
MSPVVAARTQYICAQVAMIFFFSSALAPFFGMYLSMISVENFTMKSGQ